ncbi:hypothetical protein KUCAC02_022170 [Chaenocephalus aceratus]|nr:hypothetical protein KUCAC02_022170 [Chaenocephalus aceratus]
MEPETPGTSYGPPASNSAQTPPTSLNCTLQSSCSPHVRDDLMPAKCSRARLKMRARRRGGSPRGDPQPSPPPSAGTPTLREKPSMPSTPFHAFSVLGDASPLVRRLHQCVSFLLLSRLDGEDDREPGEVQHSHTEPDSSPPVEGHGDNNASTKADEPNASQPSQTDCERHMEET